MPEEGSEGSLGEAGEGGTKEGRIDVMRESGVEDRDVKVVCSGKR